MKIICVTLLIFLLGAITTQSSEIDKEKNVDNEVEQSEVMQMLLAIMNDSEFLSLNSNQQLRVLVALYSMLQDYFETENSEGRQKRDISKFRNGEFWRKFQAK